MRSGQRLQHRQFGQARKAGNGRKAPNEEDEKMSLINLVLVLIVIGVLLWLANTYIPIDGKIKQIINAVVVIAVVLWLISIFLGPLPDIRVGQ